jgi:hypothetical protein
VCSPAALSPERPGPSSGHAVGQDHLAFALLLEFAQFVGVRSGSVGLLQTLHHIRHAGKARVEETNPGGTSAEFVPQMLLCKDLGLQWLARYVDEVRPLLAIHAEEQALFLTGYGRGFTPNSLGNLITQTIRKTKVRRTGSCHLLRLACATHMLERGADVRVIQQLLVHAKLETTQVYTEVSIKLLQDVHARTHPQRPGVRLVDAPSLSRPKLVKERPMRHALTKILSGIAMPQASGRAVLGSENRVVGSEGSFTIGSWDERPANADGIGGCEAWSYELASDVCVGPNLYTYVRQNPWTSFDPEGLWSWGSFAKGFAIGGAVAALVVVAIVAAPAIVGMASVAAGATAATAAAAAATTSTVITVGAAAAAVYKAPQLAGEIASVATGADVKGSWSGFSNNGALSDEAHSEKTGNLIGSLVGGAVGARAAGAINEAARGGLARTASAEEATLAVSQGAEEGAATSMVSKKWDLVNGRSTKAATKESPREVSAEVAKEYQNLPGKGQGCGEADALTKADARGIDMRGGASSTRRVGGSAPGQQLPACERCDPVLTARGIKDASTN